jgi:hypothetical protein
MSDARLVAWLNEIIAEHRRLWLARNRPGGLRDSCAQLEARFRRLRLITRVRAGRRAEKR